MHKEQIQGELKPIIRTDNGPQFIADNFERCCLDLGLFHERIPFKTPNKNAHIESFHSILELECLAMHEFKSFAHAYAVVSSFMKFYNDVRIHSSTKFMAPREYSKAIMSKSIIGEVVNV